MSNFVVMIPSATPGDAVSSPPYATVEEALSGAKYMLSNGAALAWILDGKGEMALPAEQVKSRLEALEGSSRPSLQMTGLDKPGFSPLGLSGA